MATTYKVLGQLNPAANTLSNVYTVPAATQAVISTITVCNQSASNASYSISVSNNGVAQLSIPAGYKVKSSGVEAPTTKPESTTTTPSEPTGGGGGDGSDVGGGTTTGSNISMTPDGAVANTVSPTVGSVVGGLLGLAFGVPVGLASNLGKSAIAQQNFIAEQEAMNVNVAIADTSNPANNEGVTTAAATPGAGGTGGAAASAAADAAAAAAAAGHSPEAQGAASQAAADATVSGADAAAAAAAAADAANAAAADAADAEGGGLGTAATGGEGGVSGGVSGVGPDGIGFAKGGFVSKRKDKKYCQDCLNYNFVLSYVFLFLVVGNY